MEKDKLIENGCTCDRCENKYKIDLILSDELWSRIARGSTMLCPQCIGARLEMLDEFGAYLLTSLTAPVDGKELNPVEVGVRFTNDEIYELGKKEVSYERQLAVLGKKEADCVLYFWMEGYNKAIQDFNLIPILNRLYDEVKHGDDEQQKWLRDKFDEFSKTLTEP